MHLPIVVGEAHRPHQSGEQYRTRPQVDRRRVQEVPRRRPKPPEDRRRVQKVPRRRPEASGGPPKGTGGTPKAVRSLRRRPKPPKGTIDIPKVAEVRGIKEADKGSRSTKGYSRPGARTKDRIRPCYPYPNSTCIGVEG